MIACLYGRNALPWVESTLRDLVKAGNAAIRPLSIEAALADPAQRDDVHRLYVLPFDPPAASGAESKVSNAASIVAQLFPRVEVFNGFNAQELCWDKIASEERLMHRGVPVPDTLITDEPGDVEAFMREHGFAILKERFGCAGQGHMVVWKEGDDLVTDSGTRNYKVELTTHGRRRVVETTLFYPAPFYVQRMVSDGSPASGPVPGQLLRAYVVDGHVVFWTERFRERYRRPADWIVNVSRGARYRFVLNVSEEARKIAVRSAEAVGMRAGAVDILRTPRGAHYVLEVDCDSYHMLIDRQFKDIPDYRDFFDFDRYVAEALLAEAPAAEAPVAAAPRRPAPQHRPLRAGRSRR